MIKLNNVSMRYGNFNAIDNITMNIGENQIYCLLGCNGAGKTTLMKMIAGHINPSAGDIEVNGSLVSTAKMPCDVSFIDNRAIQFNAKLVELIHMASKFDERFDIDFAFKMIKKFHLDKGKRFGQLSFGMQTIFNTLLSLASNRKIVLLDEPLLGLDVILRNKFYNLLNDSFEHTPRTVIISSHLIDEITRNAAELMILDKGKLLFQSTINEFDEKAFSITGSVKTVMPALERLNVVGQKIIGGHMIAYIYDDSTNIPKGMSVQSTGLQEFFINLVGGDFDEE